MYFFLCQNTQAYDKTIIFVIIDLKYNRNGIYETIYLQIIKKNILIYFLELAQLGNIRMNIEIMYLK